MIAADQAVAEAVARHPLLASLDDAAPLAEYLERTTVPPATAVVTEGDDGRDMFFVLSGRAKVLRGDLEVGRLRPGDHFGEMALMAGRPRAAGVVSLGEVELLRLTQPAFERLASEHPSLAMAFVRRLIGGLGEWLSEMTHSVDMLMRERSLPRRTHVSAVVGGRLHKVRTGTKLADLLPEKHEGEFVVAGLVDRRPASLSSALTSDAVVEPLTTAHWEGSRIYRTSLALLLLEAAHRRRPDLTIRIQHSLGFAQHVSVKGEVESLEALAAEFNAAMSELVDADLPLREEFWTVEEARAHFEQVGWKEAVDLLATWRDAAGRLVSYGHVYALQLSPMVHRTRMLSGFCLLPDRDGLLLVYGTIDPVLANESADDPPQDPIKAAATVASRHTEAMLRDHRHWLEAMGTTSAGELNRACIEGDVPQLIRIAEGFQEKRISQIADAIAARGDDVKVVCIAGPSSAGKTTFIKRLKVQLQVDGLHPKGISLDDYYVDRERAPRDEHGELDFETLDALQVDLLQQHVLRLLDGERVATARFDFFTGISQPEGGTPLELRAGDLLMLEGIHGLNPAVLESVPDARIFRIFICPLAQLPFDRLTRVRASDLRLLRRIVRDRHRRGSDAAEAIMRWPSVRRGERHNIFPFQHHADEVFDSSLIYELSVLKVLAEGYLLEVPQHHPAYTTAFRLLRTLDRFVTIWPDHVPPTSLLREFIGGSGFEY